MKKSGVKRIQFLDELRGFAILAMIVHHIFYDIGFVLDKSWGTEVFDKLCIAQPLFWGIFIIISGICSRLSRNTVKRGCIVLGSGLVITLVTAVIMPKFGITGAEIYFGILHCLGCCMIITGILMPVIKKIKPVAGMIVSAALFLTFYTVSTGSLLFGLIKLPLSLYSNNYFAPLGFYSTSFYSADYFGLLPWIFLFLFGAFVGAYAKEGRFPSWTYKKRSRFLAFVGRNSLWFYLAHQPVIFAVMVIIGLIIN